MPQEGVFFCDHDGLWDAGNGPVGVVHDRVFLAVCEPLSAISRRHRAVRRQLFVVWIRLAKVDLSATVVKLQILESTKCSSLAESVPRVHSNSRHPLVHRLAGVIEKFQIFVLCWNEGVVNA
jgi:hypothetical protein